MKPNLRSRKLSNRAAFRVLSPGALLVALLLTMANIITNQTLLAAPAGEPPEKKESDKKEPAKDEWRVIIGATSGQMSLDLRTFLSYTLTDPTTGKKDLPVLGRLTGLTTNGSLDVQVRGVGPQNIAQGILQNKNWTFSYGYSRVKVDFMPLSDDLLPLSQASGYATGNVHQGSVEYRFRPDTAFNPFVRLTNGSFHASYKVRNVVSSIPGSNYYASLPVVDADDAYSSNSGMIGARIAIPIQSWYIAPFLQAAANRYTINVRAGGGALSTHTNYIPDNPSALLSAWAYQNNSNATTFDQHRTVPRNDGSAGMILFMDYKKFLSLQLTARRNYDAAAWNLSAVAALFFHPNAGFIASVGYAEPEITRTLNRSWSFGPVVTFTF